MLGKTPNFDRLYAEYPVNTLVTHGERVGLPADQMGNSEVGHLNIGAGRVVEQWLLRISRALASNFLEESDVFNKFIEATKNSPAIHLIGLYSDGGVHSSHEHLLLLLKKLCAIYDRPIYLHLITDGRDTSPNRALDQIRELREWMLAFPQVSIKTICGRFYAMDRDNRWERTRKAYDAIMFSMANDAKDPLEYICECYSKGVTDEFIEPAVFSPEYFGPKDGVIFWNFREDRMRQIVKACCMQAFSNFPRSTPIPPADRVLCFTDYDHTYHLPFLFEALHIENHLGEVISRAGLQQLRVAETEKYAHVTYFFNGGVETEYSGESRSLIPSPRDVKTYDLKPEMSAAEVCDVVLDAVRGKKFDFIVVNFANCDMVGHTGVLEAGIKAVETVDACLGKIVGALEQVGGKALIIADHGNAEYMINEDGTPNTAHTKFPVPVILFGMGKELKLRSGAALCDVAPTILKMMGLPQPDEMTGQSLF